MASPHKDFPNLFVLDHPLIQHKLSIMRDKTTSTTSFRQLLKEIAGRKVAVVPILRAGLGMADGLLELIPAARMGHVGLYRDHETKRPVEYFVKLPDPEGRIFILVDPMLATGHSASAAVDVLNKRGVSDDNIRFMALVAAPEGVEVLSAAHPTIPVYVAALDSHLNENAYIVPGLGDAGDRLFGTK
jgi:uracil phosphoribosyltransferase